MDVCEAVFGLKHLGSRAPGLVPGLPYIISYYIILYNII